LIDTHDEENLLKSAVIVIEQSHCEVFNCKSLRVVIWKKDN